MDFLRRFTLVGVVATVVDLAVFIVLVNNHGFAAWSGDVIAVAIATAVSWTLHGIVTVPDELSRRWYRRPLRYLRAAGLALFVDVCAIALLAAPIESPGIAGLVGIKLVSLSLAFVVRVLLYRISMFADVRAGQSRPILRPEPPGDVRLSVVIPAYMEADRIAGTVNSVREALLDLSEPGDLELVVVDDGSTDATASVAREAGADRVIVHDVNRGKGAAVRSGSLVASGRVVAFTDADLSYEPSQLIDLLLAVEAGWDVVVGSRMHVDTRTVVRAGRLRELGGRLINLLTAYVLLGRYRDTQCGLKAMRSDAAKLLFEHGRIDGFAFDVELFALIERYRLALLEVPVTVVNSERSTVRVMHDALRLVIDLFRIRANGRLGRYDLPEGQALAALPSQDNEPST